MKGWTALWESEIVDLDDGNLIIIDVGQIIPLLKPKEYTFAKLLNEFVDGKEKTRAVDITNFLCMLVEREVERLAFARTRIRQAPILMARVITAK